MAERAHILVIDQGTTSTRAILFDPAAQAVATARRPLRQIFPRPGWVEYDPEEIWDTVRETAREAVATAPVEPASIAAIGITNQRETTVIWHRGTGRPIHNAIGWQDRRTSAHCARLSANGHAGEITRLTGLVVDPYFSATKIAWLLDSVDGARSAAKSGSLAFGTIDSFLLWRLTGGAVHATDATNAARTMLFDIAAQQWSQDLLEIFRIPAALMPRICDSAAEFGQTVPQLLDRPLPILAVAGDQHAALVGQGCVAPGTMKCTYGTGAFALLNTGAEPARSRGRLLTTLSYRVGGVPAYALEGSIFMAGAAVQWLRDGLKLFPDSARSETLAAAADPDGGVVLVPAFAGLGAPYWDADARGAVFGLTRDSGPADLARAALDAVAFQTRDLIDVMKADGARPRAALRVDGGMANNDWFLQRMANLIGMAIERPPQTETTALGAARLASLGAGLLTSLDDIAQAWRCDRRFDPVMAEDRRDALYRRWRDAIDRVRTVPKTG